MIKIKELVEIQYPKYRIVKKFAWLPVSFDELMTTTLWDAKHCWIWLDNYYQLQILRKTCNDDHFYAEVGLFAEYSDADEYSKYLTANEGNVPEMSYSMTGGPYLKKYK